MQTISDLFVTVQVLFSPNFMEVPWLCPNDPLPHIFCRNSNCCVSDFFQFFLVVVFRGICVLVVLIVSMSVCQGPYIVIGLCPHLRKCNLIVLCGFGCPYMTCRYMCVYRYIVLRVYMYRCVYRALFAVGNKHQAIGNRQYRQ